MEMHDRWVEARARMGAPVAAQARPVVINHEALKAKAAARAVFKVIALPEPDRFVDLCCRPSASTIMLLVAHKRGVDPNELDGVDYGKNLTRSREEISYLLYTHMEMSYVQIGRLLRRGHPAIYVAIQRHCKRLGIAFMARSAPVVAQQMVGEHWTEQQRAKARELWNSGLTARAVGKIMGKTKNAILGQMNRHGGLKRQIRGVKSKA